VAAVQRHSLTPSKSTNLPLTLQWITPLAVSYNGTYANLDLPWLVIRLAGMQFTNEYYKRKVNDCFFSYLTMLYQYCRNQLAVKGRFYDEQKWLDVRLEGLMGPFLSHFPHWIKGVLGTPRCNMESFIHFPVVPNLKHRAPFRGFCDHTYN
jgi:hypothetical protein